MVNDNSLGAEGARYLLLTNLYVVLYSPLRIIYRQKNILITLRNIALNKEKENFFQLQNGIKETK